MGHMERDIMQLGLSMHSSRRIYMKSIEKKLGVRRAGRIFSFITILIALMYFTSFVLMPKGNAESAGMENPNEHGFYGEPKDTIQIAIIGNSDAYSGISPLELWNQHGYTAYVAGEGSMALSQSVIMLKNMLKNQKPKLVILETDVIFSGHLHNTLVSAVQAKMPLFQYHNRWKSVKARDMFKKPHYKSRTVTKGQYISNDIVPYTGPEYMVKCSNKRKIPWYSKIYLDQFVELCQENNIQLLMVEVPSFTSWDYVKHNSVQSYADENGLTFIDMDLKRQEFGFDWKTDSRDGGNHLNCDGAKKATRYLGDYIKNNYDLKDNRSDPAYSQWNEDYKEYSRIIAK
jgi:hypothetical protein